MSGALVALAILSGCGNEVTIREYRAPTRADVDNQVTQYSSRVFDALEVKAMTGMNEGRIPRDCSASEGKIYGVDHFWQVDDLQSTEIGPAVTRLHDYLKAGGWDIGRYETPPTVPSPVLSATNPRDGYVIWVKGIEDQKRVAVQVASPCVTVASDRP
ncbi:hypothetical protein [Embleya sp. NPDC020886]|uniref:hypothetical protein n=1 Tax=Embleya sp. NPDC020886 TaxID=3363980 RepID=UPI0037AD4674